MGNTVGPLWADAPAMTRIITVAYLAVSLGTIVLQNAFPMLPAMLTCNYLSVVYGHFWWTLVTSPFFRPFQGGMSFIMVLFELYMAVSYFPTREKEVGSGSFLAWIFMVVLVINSLFLVGMFGLCHFYDPQLAMFPSSGLWGIILVDLTLRSLANPEGTTSFWGAIDIPNKWYPVFLVVVFSLFSMSPLWDLIAALAAGYLYPLVRLGRCLPRVTRVNSIERRCCSAPRVCFGGSWVFATETQGYDVETGARRYANLGDLGSTTGQQDMTRSGTRQPPGNARTSSSSNFTAFAGSGQRLGDGGDSMTQPLAATQPQLVQQAEPPQQEMQMVQPQNQGTAQGTAQTQGTA